MKRVFIVETNLVFAQPLTPRQATRLFVTHHFGDLPIIGYDTNKLDARWTHNMHIKERGWAGIAYHYLVKTNGIIERGRPRQTIGSHCKGHNLDSVGVCLACDCTASAPPAEMVNSLIGLYADLCDIYGRNPEDTIKGHRDLVATTECPGDALYAVLPDIRRRVRGLLGY